MGQTINSLLTILSEKADTSRLLSDLEKIREVAAELLKQVVKTFPEYTMHDISHSDRILEILGRVLPDGLKKELNCYELFFLAAAAYCHDMGMVNFSSLYIPENLKETKLIAAYIRDNHHNRSETYLAANFKGLHIDDNHQASIIGRIARGHRRENLGDQKLFESNRVYKGFAINVQLLAALIRLGDTLDITFERAPIVVFEHLPIKDPMSIDEWRKSLSVSGVVRLPDDPLVIKSDATCSSPKIHRLLKRIERDTNDQLDNLPDFLHVYRRFSKDLPRKFYLEITTEGYEAHDLRFSIEESQITNLLKGYALYKSPSESIRELVKNSVDACRARKEQIRKTRGKNCYSPIVVVEETSDGLLSIQDNGIGMNLDTIERYFTKLGRSFYASSEFSENYTFTPLSELGIGFLSSFMIADKVVVETKTNVDPPILMEIDDVADFFTVRKGKLEEPGTCVTLSLKEGFDISLEDALKHYARHIEFPIKFSAFDRKGELTITDQGFKPKGRSRTLNPYTITVNEPFLEGIIVFSTSRYSFDMETFVQQELDVLGRLELSDLDALDRLELSVGAPRFEKDRLTISNEGIFVGHKNVLPQWLNPVYFYYDLNLKRKIIDLNIARNDLVKNEKFKKFSEFLENIILDTFGSILKASEEKTNFCKISTAFTNAIIDLGRTEVNTELPSKLTQLLSTFAYIKCFSENGLTYIRAAEIIGDNRKITPLFNLSGYSDSDIRRIFSMSTNFSKNTIYPSMELSTYRLISAIFDNYQSLDFLSLLDYTISYELSDIIPKNWKLLRFNHFSSKRIIEFCHGENTIINKDNPFLKLLIKHKNTLTSTQKLALARFFETLQLDLKRDFRFVQEQQESILRSFATSKIIEYKDIASYTINKEDFPTHLL